MTSTKNTPKNETTNLPVLPYKLICDLGLSILSTFPEPLKNNFL